MLKNYLITAWRNIKRHPFFSIINILSLGISMTISLLIILMLVDQQEYDQFHSHKHRIYRVLSKSPYGFAEYATTPLPIIEQLKSMDGVENAVQLINSIGGDAIFEDNLSEWTGFYTSSTFFEIFSFDLTHGNPNTALNNPYSIVITEKAARRLFGKMDPMNKVVYFEEKGLKVSGIGDGLKKGIPLGYFTITGVVNDTDIKSHIKFDMLVSASTIMSLENKGIMHFSTDNWHKYTGGYTYIMLKEGHKADYIAEHLTKLGSEKYAGDKINNKLIFKLQALPEITPGKYLDHPITFRMPLVIYYVFLFFALMIILIACFNYTNLSVARATKRAREIGVRKVNGASRKQLILQFLSESVLVSLISLVLSLILLQFLKAAFLNLWVNQYFAFDFNENVKVYVLFFAFSLGVGILAGVFPAFFLSKLNPSIILNNIIRIKTTQIPLLKKISLQKALIIFQFSIALFFIITAILIFKQVEQYARMDYGFKTTHIINIDLQGHTFDKVKSQFSLVHGVEQMAGADQILTKPTSNITYVEKEDSIAEQINLVTYQVSSEYLETLEIELLAGSAFQNASVNENMVLINEQAMKRLGIDYPVNAIGMNLFAADGASSYKVIGVVKDFVHSFIFAAIDNVMLRYNPDSSQYAHLKIITDDLPGTVDKMKKQWQQIDDLHPLKYEFFSDQVRSSYEFLGDINKIVGFISAMAILISCFGLLGITTFNTETRIKEVGIRKVMGAKIWEVNWLLSKNFVTLIMVSVLISAPLAYYVNNIWLIKLAHRVDLNAGIIISGISIMLILGMAAIIIQTTRIACINPADTLRNE